ncbi:MAG: UDP-N-acetylmuramoyl-L-alanine--D-glutamate ligase [Angelakisella sp.]|jgi:UDP-N-acetylmuramoylalanine--D-glutamate ligase|nr:UDP-N-acetylmuramoyl-L-alanine--D-glutamate ligase [Angelakisella sp.]
MEQRIPNFFQLLGSKKVGMVGLGVTNNGIAKMLAAKGIHVTIHDRQERAELGDICREMEEAGVSLVLGHDYLRRLEEDIIFRAPGVPFDLPELVAARKEGRVITSDLEMFFDLCPCPIIGVTGSDGKTTTTTLIAEMLRAEGKTVHLGGNIGKALFPEIETVSPEDYAVVELSSFQLISLRRSPDIAVVTNVSPNHLDIHGTMKAYVAAKRNILLHQNAFGKAVLNADNDLARKYAPDVRGSVCTFSRQVNVYRGAWEDQYGTLWYSENGSQTRLMRAEEIRIPGTHNVQNYLAAITAVWGLVSLDTIRKVAHEFAGVEHRIEFVRELDGVRWYNDSIATSPSRTIAGLLSFDQQIIVIAGGYDKKIPYAPLAPVLLEKAKVLILTGATAPKIEAAVTDCPGWEKSGLKILHAAGLEEAVQLARQEAREGDIVSLSPASASFDRYKNFEARGRHYKQLVEGL